MDAQETQRPSPRPARSASRSLVSGTLVLAALVPVALLSWFAYRLAANRMLDLVRSSNHAAAVMTGELIRSDLARNIDMARALAAQPGMRLAVKERNADAVRVRLKASVDAINHGSGGAVRRIDRAFVADPKGVEWSDYPHAPESIGVDFSSRDWYRGVSRDWEPYLSTVYQRHSEPRILIVAMAAPVRDAQDGKVTGILVFQMPLQYLSDTLKAIPVGTNGYVYAVDRRGTVVAHPRLPDLRERTYTAPAGDYRVQMALADQPSSADYNDPISNEPMVASFHNIAVPNGTWAVVAQQPAEEVYGPVRRLGTSIAIAGGVVALTAFGLVASLRRASVRDRKLSAELERTAAAERVARVEAQEAHDTLQQAQGLLVQTEKLAALGQLVAGVAHEINNPLSFVLNNVAVLQRDLAAVAEIIRLYQSGDEALGRQDPALMKRIRALADEVDLDYTMAEVAELPARSREGLVRIQHIVKDLRDFARQNAIGDVQSGADLNAGIASTLNIARGTARKHRIELVSDLTPLPGVTCSPGKINQVVLNLVSNAVDATPDGGRVIVRTRPLDGGIEIKVIDNGSGIDPAVRGRIFDPFFTTKPQGEGTGLGLSISHGIICDHGGRIDVESARGAGTTFTVFLPLTPPASRGDARGGKLPSSLAPVPRGEGGGEGRGA